MLAILRAPADDNDRLPTVISHLMAISQAYSDNPNFVLWSTYMSMVEILLDFIRTEKDGNWIPHLEAFTAMHGSQYMTHNI